MALAGLRAVAKPRRNKYIPIKPHPKQYAFLLMNNVQELFYGGAAGGGKSEIVLAGAAQYVDVPHYSALILRQSYTDLSQPGSLMDRALSWWKQTDARWNATTMTWTFPSGAKIKFGYLKTSADKYQYNGAEYQYIAFDELTQFPEEDYLYLFSRLRRAEKVGKVPLRVRGASNPGDIGHDWVKRRFIDPATREPGSVFIPARIEDNPSLTLDEYEQALAKLDPVTRMRLRAGDWDVTEEGEMFHRSWFPIVDHYPRDGRVIRYWDLASTKALAAGDPDWTAGVKMVEKGGQFWVIDVKRWRESPRGNEDGILTTAEYDGKGVRQVFEEEPGASGKIIADHYRRNVLPGYDVQFRRPKQSAVAGQGKLERARPFSAAVEAGNVHLLRARWNMAYLDELVAFPNAKYHDDQVDASSGAHTVLSRPGRVEVRARSASYRTPRGRG